MKLVRPMSIPALDAEWMEKENLTEEALIRRAGLCVAKEVAAHYRGGEVLILAGGGNNGADGYAAAIALRDMGIKALVADVLGKGQRSQGGLAVLAAYRALYGEPLTAEELYKRDAAILVDAILGSGAKGELSPAVRKIAGWMARQKAFKIAVDIPIGVDADLGEVSSSALRVDMTVVLSVYKRGLLSYPAREYCGRLVYADLSVPEEIVEKYCAATATDETYVKKHMPPRAVNSHKGTFGKIQMFAGSKRYRGAAHLAASGALRMGVGLLRLTTEEDVLRLAGQKLPELLMDPVLPITDWTEQAWRENLAKCADVSAILVGPGCGVTEALFRLADTLVHSEGAPLLLDADALGAIAAYADDVDAFFAAKKRAVAMTPHPLEFARLIDMSVPKVQAERMRLAVTYAGKWGVSLLLKGAGTIITDGDALLINTSGSSALAKGGSGDVLCGAVGALLAQGCTPMEALGAAAYLHGAAGNSLAEELSEYGVLPSDLPIRMAQTLNRILRKEN